MRRGYQSNPHNRIVSVQSSPGLLLQLSTEIRDQHPSPTDLLTKSQGKAYRSDRLQGFLQCAISLTLLAFMSFPNVTAQERTSEVLVSNWSQSVSATSLVDDERLQSFMTGSHSDGYILTHIELDFVLNVSVDSFTVNVWTTNGNRPGNRIAILETREIAVGEPTVFTSSTPVLLQPNAQYFLHVAVKKPNDLLILKATKSGAEDRTIESTSWQIADDSIHIPSFGSTSWISEASVIKIRIFGYARDLTQAESS